jgi:hypothetical protein
VVTDRAGTVQGRLSIHVPPGSITGRSIAYFDFARFTFGLLVAGGDVFKSRRAPSSKGSGFGLLALLSFLSIIEVEAPAAQQQVVSLPACC